MGILFRQSRQPTPQEIADVPPPSDEDLYNALASSAAGVVVMVALKLAIGHWNLLGPSAEGDKLGAELKKGVPVAVGLAVAYFVYLAVKAKGASRVQALASKQD